jgi:predicted AlkP superfamily pyrophosphatase or phosphodiesterase
MKSILRFIIRLALGLALANSALVSAPARSRNVRAAEKPRALVISLDGLDFRYLKNADQYGRKIPNLRRLMRNGLTAPVFGIFPTLTYPSHTTLVTGVQPDRHGIYGNSKIEPLDKISGDLDSFATSIKVDTLWDAARRDGLKVGLVSWPVATGAGDYNAPEILHIGNSSLQNLALLKANATPPGLIDEIVANNSKLFANVTKVEQDDMRTGFAEYIIEHKRPELMFVHLFDFDHWQHEKGPFTPTAFAALEKLDADVGRMLAAAERAGTLTRTTVFLVTDHGFLPTKWQINAGVALVKAGLITLADEPTADGGTRTVVKDWKIMPYITGASCALILKDPNDKETARKARLAMEELSTESDDGRPGRTSPRMTILSPAQIRARHSNPRATLMLEANPDYLFGSNFTGATTIAAKQLGQHGYFPERYQASFIASGPKVTGRGLRAQIQMVQIAPTIAKLLGIRLRDTRERPVSLW